MNQPITDASVAAYLDAYRTTQTEYRTLSKPESEIAIEACRNGLRAALAVLVPSKENAQVTPEVVEPSDADLSRVYTQAFSSRRHQLAAYPKSKKLLLGELYHRSALRAVRNLPALERATEQDKKTAALSKILQLVTGDKHPRWSADDAVYQTRGRIADLCSAALGQAPLPEVQHHLTVRFQRMPESNGKNNWTVLLCRKDTNGMGLGSLSSGICVGRSEYYDRERYEADRMRYLIGERDTEPCILDYDPDLKEPKDESLK